MQRPRHIRKAKADTLSATVAANKQLKADGMMPTSKGYRLSPDMKHGYVFNNPSNLGRRSQFGMDGTKFGGTGGKLVINANLRGRSVFK